MAFNPKVPVAFRNIRADTWATRAGANALLKIYSGTQPVDADTAISGQTLLATLTCGATFAPASTVGIAALNAITQSNAVAGGTASFFRLTKSDGTTVVLDGTIGVSGCDLNVITTTVVNGQPFQVSSFSITELGG
jgi:hypothetical protein